MVRYGAKRPIPAADSESEPEVDFRSSPKIQKTSYSVDHGEIIESAEEDSSHAEGVLLTPRVGSLLDCTPVETSTRPSGLILQLKLVNFMCHKHLSISFGPKINFITGENGAGKSAILTALTLCLGTQSSYTSRTNLIRSLIRGEEESASVELKMRNPQLGGFKRDLFGDYIFIERRIKRDGSSKFALKNQDGRLVGSKKEDVLSVTEHFGIQADNPIVILTQETAKRFLKSAAPRELYDFFLKGTQLAQLSTDYQFIEAKMDEMTQAISKGESSMPALAKRIMNHEKQIELLKGERALQSRLADLQGELHWSKVYAKVAEIESLKKLEQKTNEKKLEAGETLSAINQDIDNVSSWELALEECRKKEAACAASVAEISTRAEEAEIEYSVCHREEKDIESAFVQLRKERMEIELNLHTETASAQEIVNKKRKQIQANIEALKKDIEMENQRGLDIMKEAEQDTDSSKTLNEELTGLQRERSRMDADLKDISNRIHSLRRAKEDSVSLYGPRVRDILSDIEKTRFDFRPVGPIGLYIKLKDQRWALAMDAIIGRLMSNFIVGSVADANRLQAIFDKYQAHHSIIRIDMKTPVRIDHEPPSQFLTALRLLDITNAAVLKCLVIQTNLQSIILMQDREQATEVIRRRPAHVDAAFTIDAFKIFLTGDHLQNFFMGQGGRGRVKMFEDHDQQIRAETASMHSLQASCKNLDSQVARIESILDSVLTRQKQFHGHQESIAKQVEAWIGQIRMLEADLMEDESLSKSSLSERLRHIKEKETQQLEAIKRIMAASKRAKGEKKRLEAEVRAAQQDLESIQKQRAGIESRRTPEDNGPRLLRHAQAQRELIQKYDTELEELSRKMDELLDEKAQLETTASSVSAKVETEKSPDDLLSEIRRIENRLVERMNLIGDPRAILAACKADKETYSMLQSETGSGKALREQLAQSLKERRRRWRNFRKDIAHMSNLKFIWFLGQRDKNGSLNYDFENEKLDIKIFTRSGQTQGGNARSLSGGEGSFGTVAFLFSLWESITSPLKCLDEFDVFLDGVNREQLISMLLEFALRSHEQFIFITPHSMPRLSNHRDVRVIKLRAPERGQAVIQSGA